MVFRYDVIAPNRLLMRIPARTMERVALPLVNLLTAYAPATQAIAPRKANRVISTAPKSRRIASAAPNPAPDDAPRMSGDTSGFWNIPW